MKKYLLIYSQESANIYGFNLIKTTDGGITRYTNLTENHENWQESYKWKDAFEVGYAESLDDIIQLGIKSQNYYEK